MRVSQEGEAVASVVVGVAGLGSYLGVCCLTGFVNAGERVELRWLGVGVSRGGWLGVRCDGA